MPSTCYLGHANCVLSNVHLDFLAQHTVKDWNRIVLILQVEQSFIDEISVSCKTSAEKAYEGYQKWHQKFPKETCCCALFEALKCVGRNDIISLLKKTYGFTDPSLKQKCHYELTSVCYFVGREEEVKEVQDFCKTEQRDAQLLVLLGLPGIGKTEIINEALQSSDRNKIVRVNFITRENIKWSFENIAQCILKKWKSVIDHDISGDIDLFDVLGRKNEGVILVLEFAHLDFDEFVFPRFYNAINQLLRNKYSELKIITTCCQLPNSVHTEQVFAKVIYVRDLNKEDSMKLINGMNPALSSQTCEDIFNRCGGSPFMLRKIGAETKQSCGSQEKIKEFIHKIESPLKPDYLSPLIRRTVWLSDMTNVFDALDVNEKTILVKLSVFHKVIPEWCITEIFNGKVDIEEVDHLCNIHCILDKIDNNIYQISELYKTFIWEYTAQEKNKSYNKIQEEAKVNVTKYFLNILSMLASMFFSKSDPLCTNFIKYHQKICSQASSNCRCNNFLISKDIFIRFKYMILKSLHRGIQCHPQMAVSVLLKSIQFLRRVLPHEQLVEVCVTVRKEDQQLSAREQAVLLANMVFIKIHKGCTNEQKEYKKMLDLAIKELRNYQNYQNSATYEECLILCLLKRAYIKAVFLSENSEEDLEVASEKIKKLKKAQRIKFNLNGVTADVLRSCKEDEEALLHRRKQATAFCKYLGDHPLTATSLVLLGKCSEKSKDSLQHYENALKIYKQLGNSEKDTAKIYLSLGKIYQKRRENNVALQYFESAKAIAKGLFKRHKEVKSSYQYSSGVFLLSVMHTMNAKEDDIKALVEEVKSIRSTFKEPRKLVLSKSGSHKKCNLTNELNICSKFSVLETFIVVLVLVIFSYFFTN